MAPPRHLKLTHPKKSLSSYSGSSFSSSSSSSPAPAQAPAPAPAPVPAPASDPAPDVPDCDNPLPTTEWVDSAERTEGWVWAGQPNGSRANSPVDTAATPPRQSGTPAPAETSAPKRSASAFRSRSLSAHGSPRPLPSAATIPAAAAPSDGERGIERKAPGGSIWSASPRPPARRAPVSVPDDAPAPSQSFSASGPRVLISISSGSKRSRDTGDDGAGERSSQRRRRSASHGRDSRRPSASVLGDEPASSPSPPVSGPRALGSTSSGSKRTRDVEDDGAGETSPQRRRTASAELQLRRSSASGSGSGSSRSTSGGERSRPAPAVDAAVLTDRVGSADLVAAPAQPVALSVVAAVNIVDIEPADGPAVAVEAAVEAAVAVNPVPLPDRAESRLQARIDALFARNRGRMRADRSTMHRSLESLALAARAHHGSPGSPGWKARLRNPRRRVQNSVSSSSVAAVGSRFWHVVRCRFSASVAKLGPGLWLVACALAAPSPRISFFFPAFDFRHLSTSVFLGFASTADVPRCHHLARFFRSVMARSCSHGGMTWSGLPWGGGFTFAVSMKDPRFVFVLLLLRPLWTCALFLLFCFLVFWFSGFLRIYPVLVFWPVSVASFLHVLLSSAYLNES